MSLARSNTRRMSSDSAIPEVPANLCRILAGDESLRLVYLFGSHGRGEARSSSDVDLAVLAGGPLSMDRETELRLALQEADVASVDLVDLAKAPPLLLKEIVDTGQLLLCRDPRECAEFEMRARAIYLDTHYLRRVQEQYMHQRIGELRARQS